MYHLNGSLSPDSFARRTSKRSQAHLHNGSENHELLATAFPLGIDARIKQAGLAQTLSLQR